VFAHPGKSFERALAMVQRHSLRKLPLHLIVPLNTRSGSGLHSLLSEERTAHLTAGHCSSIEAGIDGSTLAEARKRIETA
jgi:hypothetical protein